MAIGIDDLDDDDIIENSLEQNNNDFQAPVVPPNLEDTIEDYVSDFLKSRGIDDSDKINFENDNGEIETRSWKDLSKEEKINILNTPLQQNEVDNANNFSDEELQLISLIRENNLTPSQYLELLKQEPLNVEPSYKIDDLSDDEVYLLDLESRVGELSDEEAALALNLAKQNEDFYKKLIEGIRKEYKNREDEQSQLEQAELEYQLQQAFEDFKSNIVNAIDNFNSIGDLDLNFEDSDKEELAEFILSQDESGNNYLHQALLDPETLTKAAWFILNGEEAFNNVSDYFIKLIKTVSENQYKKGLEDGKKGVSSKPTTIILDNLKNNNRPKNYTSIDDLDDDN